jgi:hypothetical protein
MLLPMLKERLANKDDRYYLDAALTSVHFLQNFTNNVLVIPRSHLRTGLPEHRGE